MNLLLTPEKAPRSAQCCLIFCLSIFLLQGCAPLSSKLAHSTDSAVTKNADSDAEKKEVDSHANDAILSLPLTPELVYYILTAETAIRRNKITVAADLYYQAATLTESIAVASHAAQIAMFSRDDERINRALDRWLEVDPKNTDIYIMKAPFLILKGEDDALVHTVNTSLTLSPDKTRDYLDRLSKNLQNLAKPDRALSLLKRLDSYKKNNPDALFTYARLAALFGRYESALPVADLVLKQQPDWQGAYLLKAKILQNLNKRDEAIAVLKKIARKKTATWYVRFNYAALLGESNKIDEARAILTALNKETPDNINIVYALGILALKEENGKKAKQYFNQLITLGDPSKQANYLMGLAEELDGNIDNALAWFIAVPADSNRFDSAQLRYINLLAESQRLAKARLHLQSLRKQQPERAVTYYLLESSLLVAHEEYHAAFDLYTEALSQYPDHIELLYERAMIAERLNRLAVLEQDFRAILMQNPDNDRALNGLGYTLTDRTNRHEEALILIKKAVALKPNDPFYLDSLGWVHYRLGNLDKAAFFLEKAIEIQDHPEFLAHLGEVLWMQNKQNEAKRIWRIAIKKDNKNSLLLHTIRRFGL